MLECPSHWRSWKLKGEVSHKGILVSYVYVILFSLHIQFLLATPGPMKSHTNGFLRWINPAIQWIWCFEAAPMLFYLSRHSNNDSKGGQEQTPFETAFSWACEHGCRDNAKPAWSDKRLPRASSQTENKKRYPPGEKTDGTKRNIHFLNRSK